MNCPRCDKKVEILFKGLCENCFLKEGSEKNERLKFIQKEKNKEGQKREEIIF